MNWPTFSTDFAVAASDPFHLLVISEKLIKPIQSNSITGMTLELDKKDQYPDGGFIYMPAWLSFFIADTFIKKYGNGQDNGYEVFLNQLRDPFQMFSSVFDGEENTSVNGAMFAFFAHGITRRYFNVSASLQYSRRIDFEE